MKEPEALLKLRFLECRIENILGSIPSWVPASLFLCLFPCLTTYWRPYFDKAFLNIFQGSEEKTVVYVVGNPGRQDWQHVYTAVTRGCCRVYVIAEEPHLRRAVTNKNVPRKTHLQRFLREAIAERSNCPRPTSFPLAQSWLSQELGTQSVCVTQRAPEPPEPLTDLIKQEESAVLIKEEQTDILQQSPRKRQQTLAENSEDATKTPWVSICLGTGLKQTCALSLTTTSHLLTVTSVLLLSI